MKRTLILFAHPRYETSRVSHALLAAVKDDPAVTVRDLYELYPDFHIDVAAEQAQLAAADMVVWHFPLYMYSAPAMNRLWIELVLEYGWAHGDGGDALRGKRIFCAVTTGGTRESYAPGAFNRHTLGDFLLPFAQTARLCGMIWLPPFVVQGTYRLSEAALAEAGQAYRRTLARLAADDAPEGTISRFAFLNDWLAAGEGTP